MNFFSGKVNSVDGRDVRLRLADAGSVEISARGEIANTKSGDLEIGIRPEHIRPCNPGDAEANVSGRIELVEHLGNSTVLYVATDAGRLVVQRSDNCRSRRVTTSV